MWTGFRGMSAGNMWFDKRNLPLTFPIEPVKDCSDGETEQINLPIQQLVLFCESSKKKKKEKKNSNVIYLRIHGRV